MWSDDTTAASSNNEQANSPKITFLQAYLLAGVASGISKTVASPCERLRLLIAREALDYEWKCGRFANPAFRASYSKSFLDSARRIIAEEGFGSLWRGALPNVIQYVPRQAITFGFHESFRNFFDMDKKEKEGSLSWVCGNMALGGLAGVSHLLLLYPLDTARLIREKDVQNARKSNQERQYKGIVDASNKTVKSEGVTRLYRGFAVPCFAVFAYRSCYFGLYDTLKPLFLQGDSAKNNFFALLSLAFATTTTTGLVTFPIDAIRRHMISNRYSTDSQKIKYQNFVDYGVQVVKREGVAALFKNANLIFVQSLAGAGTLALFDFLKEYYLS